MRNAPASADLPVPPAEVIAFLDGAQDLWLASCSGFYASPFGNKGSLARSRSGAAWTAATPSSPAASCRH